MTKIITIGYPKGGSCKSHTTTNLAAVSAANGLRTLLIDLDIIGGSSTYCGVSEMTDKIASKLFGDDDIPVASLITKTPYAFDVILAGPDLLTAQKWVNDDPMGAMELHLKLRDDPAINEYDVIYIDTPPVSDGLLMAAMYASDFIISPFRLNEDDIKPMSLYLEYSAYINKKRKKLGLGPLVQLSYVISDYEMNRKVATTLLTSLYANLDPEEISPIKIPHGEAHRRAGEARMPVVLFEPASRTSAAWNMFYNEHIAPLFPNHIGKTPELVAS